MTIRIAMWSGPRNLSTAMMRAFENRHDTVVADEPFYAHYLQHTNVDHPMRDEVIKSGNSNWAKVSDYLTKTIPDGKSVWYQTNFKALLRSQTFFSFFLLGMLNGLLPCGFVYFFAITAASTASPFYGALVMIIFGLSTIPALFSLGFFVGLFKQSGLRNVMIKLAAISVILYGSYTIYNGYDYLVSPDRTILQCH